ncbi:MAG: helix-turn-helix transcriptional regulator, partial [Peptostreptococcaceae bacterium]
KEKSLLQYIRMGDKKKIVKILPGIFIDINLLSKGNEKIVRLRCLELLSLISRALIEGGLDSQIAISRMENFNDIIYETTDTESLFTEIYNIIIELVECIFILGEDRHVSLLKNAREFISSNYDQDIRVEDVAEHVLISASYLSHLFRDKLNYTVNDYLTRVRVEQSIELMKKRDLNVQEISKKVGFNSSSHFTKVFKKYIGVTPVHYKNKFL